MKAHRRPQTLFFSLFFLILTAAQAQTPQAPAEDAFSAALNATFTLEGGVQSPTQIGACARSLQSLMRRQRIPETAWELRGLSDARLVQLALLAAVAGTTGPWQRDGSTDLLLLDELGRLRPAFVPNQVESDVMLCLICALLALIAAYYFVLTPSSPPAAPSAS